MTTICGYTDAAAGRPGHLVCDEPAVPGRYATLLLGSERRSACAAHADPEPDYRSMTPAEQYDLALGDPRSWE